MLRLLVMGAFGRARGDNPLRTFYQSLMKRGKPKKVARVAAARKILVWACGDEDRCINSATM